MNENNATNSSPRVCIKVIRPNKKPHHFTEGVLSILKKEFSENQHPSLERRNEIANELGLTKTQILNWFNHQKGKFTMKSKSLLQLQQKLEQLESNVQDNQENTSGMLENYVYTPKNWGLRREFSNIEKEILKTEFSKNRHPSSQTINEIAQKFHSSHKKLYGWFAKRRSEISRLKRLIQQKQDGVSVSETDSKDESSTTVTEETDETFDFETDEKNEDSRVEWLLNMEDEEEQHPTSNSFGEVKETQNVYDYDDNGLLRQPQVLSEQVKNDEFECKKSTTKGHSSPDVVCVFGKQNCELQHFKSKGEVATTVSNNIFSNSTKSS